MFIHQSMNSFFIYQCTDYKLNVDVYKRQIFYNIIKNIIIHSIIDICGLRN